MLLVCPESGGYLVFIDDLRAFCRNQALARRRFHCLVINFAEENQIKAS